MKAIHLFLVFVLLHMLTSCFKDIGSYDYVEHEDITISGIENAYTKVAGADKITISPEVMSTDPNAKLEYCWFVYEFGGSGYVPVNDTICREKDIDYTINLNPRSWMLVFSVKNINSGLTQYQTASLTVSTQFTKGWYVSTHDGLTSNISLFYTKDTEPLVPDERVAVNVLSTINQYSTPGINGVLSFFSDYKTYWNNAYRNTRVLVHVTDKELSVIDVNSFKVVRTFNDVFYQLPISQSPVSLFYSGSGFFLNNGDAGLFSIYNMSPNSGRFGAPMRMDSKLSPYLFSKYYVNSTVYEPTLFDELSNSFVKAPVYGSDLTPVKDLSTTQLPANNINKDLLYMQARSSSKAVAVFRDKDNPSLKILARIESLSSTGFNILSDTIAIDSHLFQAKVYGANYFDENILYFSNGNEVWSRNLDNGFEQLQYSAPAGEEIVQIAHHRITTIGLNHIVVSSQSGSNYTVRMFTKQAGNLNPNPEIVITGTGNFSDIKYVNPSVNTGSYTYLVPWSK
jgi:hypothetical protein